MIKDARNRFRVSKENQAIKDKIIKDIGIRKRRKKNQYGSLIFMIRIISNMKGMGIEIIKNTLIKLSRT